MVILPHFTAHPDRWGTLCHAANNRLNRHATYVSTQKIPTRRAACPPCAIRFFPCAHKTGLFSRFPAYSPPMGITVQTIRRHPSASHTTRHNWLVLPEQLTMFAGATSAVAALVLSPPFGFRRLAWGFRPAPFGRASISPVFLRRPARLPAGQIRVFLRSMEKVFFRAVFQFVKYAQSKSKNF